MRPLTLRSVSITAIFVGTLCLAAGLAVVAAPALAQTSGTPASSADLLPAGTPISAPKTIALVSAVGAQFSYVRQKQSVGSNLDPYIRQNVEMPDQTINNAVLRGLDRAMGAEFPNSNRVLLHVAHDKSAADVLPQDREAYIFKRVISLLESMPDRKNWDEIVVVTPKWLMSERAGLGGKMAGVGLYVQPLGGPEIGADFGMGMPDEVETVDRTRARSRTFVAPFFYTTVTTLDAKTLKVLKREAHHDYRKIVDPDSTAINVQNAIPLDKLASMVERFVETAALRSLSDKPGSVEIGPVKTLPANN